MSGIGTKQQDRRKRTATIIFDNKAERVQDLLDGNAGSDHFEKSLFTGEQGFSALSFANVYSGTVITVDFARCTESGPAYTLDMLDRSVGQRDSEF
jgi:hypothetical protein